MLQRLANMVTAKRLMAAVTVLFVLVATPSQSFAAYERLKCDGSGGVQGTTTLFDAEDGGAGLCQFSGQPAVEHLFSTIVCKYAKIINQVLDVIYCDVQFKIKDALSAVIILYIAILGVQTLTGQTQLTIGEAVVRSCKAVFVWFFCTEASYGIDIGFAFFMSAMGEGVAWVVSAVNPVILIFPDDPMPAYEYIDKLIYDAIMGPFTDANSKVVGFFLVMMVAFPPIFLMGVQFLWETAKVLINCVLMFLLSISAIAFLIALSPVFLSFMLFQTTFYLFENWLRYMISYTMQIIIVFAIVTMWVLVIQQFTDFFNRLSNMIFPYYGNVQLANTYQPSDTWAICPNIHYGLDTKNMPTASCNSAPYNIPNVNPNTFTQQQKRDLIPPSRIVELKGFLYFVIFHMISLIMVAYSFHILLKNASQIAKDIVGPAHVPMLGKGYGMDALGDPSGYPRRMLAQSSTGVPSGGGRR
jgi:hypothetical protein